MLNSLWLNALVTGLATGGFCLATCFPFMGSLLVAEDRGFKKNIWFVLHFLGGRLVGYIAFGFLFGSLGQMVRTPVADCVTDLCLIILSLVLILTMIGLIKTSEQNCLVPRFHARQAATIGFLLGVNVCPPFLMSLTYVFSLHNSWQGVLYFLFFFVASSVYFLPIVFLGLLAKMKEIQWVGRVSGLISGGLFFIYGSYSLARHISLMTILKPGM
ncbi:MAG: sulfite exporter TauE/SafE family protein [Candidatus Omnitrophica bacterium]|nr:sulfite exporter TauE/SafE family protein [Candidatus Omnitrophota bacterium]